MYKFYTISPTNLTVFQRDCRSKSVSRRGS